MKTTRGKQFENRYIFCFSSRHPNFLLQQQKKKPNCKNSVFSFSFNSQFLILN